MATATKQEAKGLTLIEAIRQGIYEEMTRDETVFIIGEDIGAYGGAFKLTEGFIDEFGSERMIDTPISEAAIVGAACGAARRRARISMTRILPGDGARAIPIVAAMWDTARGLAWRGRHPTLAP